MGTTVVCVLNVDLGANFFLIFVCPVQYTPWDRILLAACVCVCVSVCVRVHAHGDLGPNISKKVEDRASVSMDNNRKWHMANRFVT